MNSIFDPKKLAWSKIDNLIPVIIQDYRTLQVLMLGYMNPEALEQTLHTGKVTFYSRSKKRLWEKGETSGNSLSVIEILSDCDQDSILILANPAGPTCHVGNSSCFYNNKIITVGFLILLINKITRQIQEKPEDSYTAKLFSQGIKRIAQKVGEEGVEVALAAVMPENKTEIIEESADLIYHLLVLLQSCSIDFIEVIKTLQARAEKDV